MGDVKHTDLPWSIDQRYPDDIIGGDGRDVAETHLSPGYVRCADEREANARFIVTACNAHDDLLAALTECLEAEERRRADLKPNAPASQYSDARIARIRALLEDPKR